MDIIKINKQKINELLYYIKSDNYEYSLIFRLLYIYGRNIHEVLNLRKIDVTHLHITFKVNNSNVKFVLHDSVKNDLLKYIENKYLNENDYIFIEDIHVNIDIYTKRLNYYLNKIINQLNKNVYLQCPKITTNDFKILRGQHLYMDGADIYTIHKLYYNSNIQSTRKNINETALRGIRFPLSNLEAIFDKGTDLNIFKDSLYENEIFYTVIKDDESCIFKLGSDGFVFVEGEYDVFDCFSMCDFDFVRSRLSLLSVGDLYLIGDFKVIMY